MKTTLYPDELSLNHSYFSCKNKNPCDQKFHYQRTYYSSYRPNIFILCFQRDYCLELGCPHRHLWNISLNACQEGAEMIKVGDYEGKEESAFEAIEEKISYDMEKYDCLEKYPCQFSFFLSPRAIFRHLDPDKFIYCNFWNCEVLECPSGLQWFQDVHKCLIYKDYFEWKQLQIKKDQVIKQRNEKKKYSTHILKTTFILKFFQMTNSPFLKPLNDNRKTSQIKRHSLKFFLNNLQSFKTNEKDKYKIKVKKKQTNRIKENFYKSRLLNKIFSSY